MEKKNQRENNGERTLMITTHKKRELFLWLILVLLRARNKYALNKDKKVRFANPLIKIFLSPVLQNDWIGIFPLCLQHTHDSGARWVLKSYKRWTTISKIVSYFLIFSEVKGFWTTQQDYYDLQYGTLLHSYCTLTYTEVTALLLWSISAVTMYYLHSYSVRVPTWVLQDNSGAILQRSSTTTSV